MESKTLKNWPMPKDVKEQNWGYTKGGTTDSKIDDSKRGIDGMEAFNRGKISRQTPKKFG